MPELTRTQFALMLHAVPHLGPKGIARVFRDLPIASPDSSVDLGRLWLWNLSADTLQREYRFHPEASECISRQKEQLLKTGEQLADAVSKLGIRVLTLSDPDYPSCIRDYEHHPPPILYAYGCMNLLRERKFAVISSASISGRGIEVTREMAGLLCDDGLTAVTSHNTHPYQIVGLAAKSRNSQMVLVLDRGILSVFPQGMGWEPVAQARIWNFRFDPAKDLVISKFRLYDPWIGANGKERDRMVFSLADVVVAVEIRPGGVMESECLHALKREREVYVYNPDSDSLPAGNENLLSKGCHPLKPEWAKSLLTTLDLPQETEELEGESQ